MSKEKNNIPLYLFHEGTNAKAYDFLGAHPAENGGVCFRVWAPNAKWVGVAGDFNGWQPENAQMVKISGGVWECTVEGVKKFDSYKFVIGAEDGRTLYKSDPYAFHTETRPNTASKYYGELDFEWTDRSWLKKRKKTDIYSSPVNMQVRGSFMMTAILFLTVSWRTGLYHMSKKWVTPILNCFR